MVQCVKFKNFTDPKSKAPTDGPSLTFKSKLIVPCCLEIEKKRELGNELFPTEAESRERDYSHIKSPNTLQDSSYQMLQSQPEEFCFTYA